MGMGSIPNFFKIEDIASINYADVGTFTTLLTTMTLLHHENLFTFLHIASLRNRTDTAINSHRIEVQLHLLNHLYANRQICLPSPIHGSFGWSSLPEVTHLHFITAYFVLLDRESLDTSNCK